MGKILPLCNQSDINGFLVYTYPYSILSTYPGYRDYLMEHYINCSGYINDANDITFKYDDGIGYDEMFHDPGPFDVIFLPYNIGLQTDVRKLIISSIDDDYYPIIFTDEYYLKSRPSYKKEHNLHEIMITGYDKNSFRYLAFDDKFKLSFSSFPQRQLIKAYKCGDPVSRDTASKWISDKSIVLLRLKGLQNEYSFSKDRFITKLGSYVSGEVAPELDSFYMPKDKCFVGVYNTNLLLYCLEHSENEIGLRYPAVHVWCESKRNLLNKLIYYFDKCDYKNSDILTAYDEKVVKQAELIRLIVLKYRRTGKLEAESTILLLKKLFKQEREILNYILNK